MINKSLEMYDFIKQCKNKHLTLGDIKKMKVNDIIDVVIWDRNFEEYWIWENAKNKQLYNAETFFEENHHQIKYKGNMEWEIIFNFGETYTHKIHLDVSNLNTYWKWYGLSDDNKIHITQEILKDNQKIPKHWKKKHAHYSEFSDNTRVGWRGPIMLWDKLKKMPQVYLLNSEEYINSLSS